MKNRLMKRVIGYSHYVDKLVYATVDGGRRKIMKLKRNEKDNRKTAYRFVREWQFV